MSDRFLQSLQEELVSVNEEWAKLSLQREKIIECIATYTKSAAANGNSSQAAGSKSYTSVGMAIAVLQEAARDMSTSEIVKAIRKRFGVNPARSLQQMLYKRAADKKTFYNQERKYGLIAWKKRT